MSIKLTDKLMHQAGMARIPISGTIELTPMCNFSCKMCYVRKSAEEVKAEGGLQTVEQWIHWAEEAKDSGMLYLLVTGGEPFTYPDFWPLYERLTQMGFVISINSNGSMLTDACVKKLSKMPPKRINITLYGASNETYEKLCGIKNGFDKIIEAVNRLKKYNIAYKFNCSITPMNRHELEGMIDVAKAQKVPMDVATYMFPPVRRGDDGEEFVRLDAKEAGICSVESMRLKLSEENFMQYAKQHALFEKPKKITQKDLSDENGKGMGCRAGRCSFWLDWQGNLSACGMIAEPKHSLKEYSFSQAWKNIVNDTNRILCLAGCAGCKNKHICHACISAAYCETGDVHGRPEYLCNMLHAEAEECKRILSSF